MLEALANGIPALYTTCPALDDIETTRSRQVPGDVEGMRREIAVELAGGRRPREGVPAIGERYGVESVARRIAALYNRLTALGRPGAPHCPPTYRGRNRGKRARPAPSTATSSPAPA